MSCWAGWCCEPRLSLGPLVKSSWWRSSKLDKNLFCSFFLVCLYALCVHHSLVWAHFELDFCLPSGPWLIKFVWPIGQRGIMRKELKTRSKLLLPATFYFLLLTKSLTEITEIFLLFKFRSLFWEKLRQKCLYKKCFVNAQYLWWSNESTSNVYP